MCLVVFLVDENSCDNHVYPIFILNYFYCCDIGFASLNVVDFASTTNYCKSGRTNIKSYLTAGNVCSQVSVI